MSGSGEYLDEHLAALGPDDFHSCFEDLRKLDASLYSGSPGAAGFGYPAIVRGGFE